MILSVVHRSQSSQEHLFQSCFFWAFIRREVLSYTGFRLWVVSSVCWYAAFIRLRSQTMPQLQSRSMRQSIRSSSLVCCEAGTKIYSPECCIPGRNSLRSRQTRKFPVPKSTGRLPRSIRGNVKRKISPATGRSGNVRRAFQPYVMMRDSGAFLFFQIHLVIVTALSVSEARQAAWLKRVNHGSI